MSLALKLYLFKGRKLKLQRDTEGKLRPLPSPLGLSPQRWPLLTLGKTFLWGGGYNTHWSINEGRIHPFQLQSLGRQLCFSLQTVRIHLLFRHVHGNRAAAEKHLDISFFCKKNKDVRETPRGPLYLKKKKVTFSLAVQMKVKTLPFRSFLINVLGKSN